MALGYSGRAEGLLSAIPCFINVETDLQSDQI